MRDQIVDFVITYPIVLIPLFFLFAPLVLVNRYRRMKRRNAHIDDPNSKALLIIGIALTAIIVVAWLMLT